MNDSFKKKIGIVWMTARTRWEEPTAIDQNWTPATEQSIKMAITGD